MEYILPAVFAGFFVGMYFLNPRTPSNHSRSHEVFENVNPHSRPQVNGFNPTHTTTERTGHGLNEFSYKPKFNGAYMRNGEPVPL
jgi:hypothetical protein